MKKKVLYVFCFEYHSGAEIVSKRLIENNMDFVEPTVMCQNGKLLDSFIELGIQTAPCKYLKPLSFTNNNISWLTKTFNLLRTIILVNLAVNRVLYKMKFDVVHSNNLNGSFYILPTVLINRFFGSKTRFIWSNHDLTYFSGNFGDKLAKLCIRAYDTTIAVSNAVKQKFPELVNKISVLYNGLDLLTFKPTIEGRISFRKLHDVGDSDVAIGILGSIVEHKGQLFVLECLEKITRILSVKLFIVGQFADESSEYSLKLKNLINSRFQNQVFILNHTENISTVYSGLDIVLNATLATVQEPLGTTIYEGMAMGKIVLASNTGGSSEIIDDKINGFLFKAGNTDDLVETLNSVLNMREKFSSISDMGLQKVRKAFDINIMKSNYNKILSNIK